MQFILFDLEATCWPPGTLGVQQEIIEIGAFRLDRLGRIRDEFHSMVKPVRHPFLSPYCQQLTGIEQEEISTALHFPRVLTKWLDWLEKDESEYYLISWGSADKLFFEQDCQLHNLEDDWLQDRCYNLKQVYKEYFKLPAKLGLQAAMRREGLEFEGNPHRALDDARNMTNLFTRHIDIWPFP